MTAVSIFLELLKFAWCVDCCSRSTLHQDFACARALLTTYVVAHKLCVTRLRRLSTVGSQTAAVLARPAAEQMVNSIGFVQAQLMAYSPQVALFQGDVGHYSKGHQEVHIIDLVRSLKVNKTLLLNVTGANDPNCTWVEADRVEMKPLAGGRVKIHLQVSGDNAQRVSLRCCAEVINSASTTVVFNGGLFKAKELAAKLCFGMRAMNSIEVCNTRSTLSKVLLMGREVRNNVWLWCDNVLPSWEEFCTKVQEDLHDTVCLH